MIRKALLILLLPLFASCWVPPYDANASNAVYISQAMEPLTLLSINELEQGGQIYDLYFDDDQIFFQRYSLMLNTADPTNSRYILFKHNGSDFFFHPLVESGGNFTLEYPSYNGNAGHSSILGVYSWISWRDPIDGTTYPLIEMNALSPHEAMDPLIRMYSYDSGLSQWISNPYSETADPNVTEYLRSSTGYFDFLLQETRFLTLETHHEHPTDQWTNWLRSYSLLNRNISLIQSEYEITNRTTSDEYIDYYDCRVAFMEASMTAYISLYQNRSTVNYKLNVGESLANQRLVPLPGVDSRSILLTSLSNGAVLYQGRESSRSFYFTLLKPSGETSRIDTGYLVYAGNYVRNGTQYLVFNQFIEINSDGNEERYIKLLQIPANNFQELFD